VLPSVSLIFYLNIVRKSAFEKPELSSRPCPPEQGCLPTACVGCSVWVPLQQTAADRPGGKQLNYSFDYFIVSAFEFGNYRIFKMAQKE
jgi:hypothetical protein